MVRGRSMETIDRRTLLRALGATSLAPLMDRATTTMAAAVAIARPGESRFQYASAQQAKKSPCKLTSEDSGGAMSIFELYVPPQSGPVRHVHHREDEWCYVAAGEFVFEWERKNSRYRSGAACSCRVRFRTCGRTRLRAMAS